MISCRICSYQMPDGARFCGGCAAPLGGDATGMTRTLASTSTPTPGQGRFAPGTLLAGRYRVLGLAGQGGMGEVYKAHDGKLDQVVALKFLPESLRRNAAALVRLHNEVRIARQVSHPNVCRVYDIGEAEGLHFLTMEFIDGEDLGHLLRRIGRFPQDKGIEMARKLCAALSAAHERRVLHRDLKPSNIMLNAAGQVVVTDFGLAGLAGDITDAGSGTPAYMAPEQLEGREVTARSDIYSLGLVLYEIFTGKRVFEGRKRGEITNPASAAKDLDPAVERVILRCLSDSPDDRPATALAVAKALPGGDPLEAALAAGETPSPEMVAAAGELAGISVRAAVLCFAGVVVCLLGHLAIGDRFQIAAYTPLEIPPGELAVKARDIAASLGYKARPADRAYGFEYDRAYVRQQKTKVDWQRVRERRPAPILFWYRESPEPLVPLGTGGASFRDPPFTVPSMISARLDPAGRLMLFQAVPPARQAIESREADWSVLFAAAGLEIAKFEETRPEWTPPVSSDIRKAWNGGYPDQPDSRIRVEAASMGGRPVYFRIVNPWQTSDEPLVGSVNARPLFTEVTATTIPLLVLVRVPLLVVCWLAWRNIRNGRGDRRGAFRFGAFVFVMRLIEHIAAGDLSQSPVRVRLTSGETLWWALLAWAAYIALEPLIRRTWPQCLISWTRLLSGRLRDPLLGRDILLGVFAGVSCALLSVLWILFVPGYGAVQGAPLPSGISWLTGGVAGALWFAAMAVLFTAVLFAIFWTLLHSRWAGAVAAWLLSMAASAVVYGLDAGGWAAGIGLGITWAVLVLVLLRFGVAAGCAASAAMLLLTAAPTGPQFSAWHQYAGQLFAGLVLLLAAYGFHTALGGRQVIGDKLAGAP